MFSLQHDGMGIVIKTQTVRKKNLSMSFYQIPVLVYFVDSFFLNLFLAVFAIIINFTQFKDYLLRLVCGTRICPARSTVLFLEQHSNCSWVVECLFKLTSGPQI